MTPGVGGSVASLRTVGSLSAGQLTLASGVHLVTMRRCQARPPEPAMREYEQAPVCGSLGPQAWAVGGRHCGVSELALGGPMPGGSVCCFLISLPKFWSQDLKVAGSQDV